ncbi:hypothetical protein [Desulfosporosinus sp.]|uniref:hypothetical protein n=1 Tax=Desulfosporosinus sp. TaxID=157907 RepID=UPI0025BAD07F|nr:hypothetical protein [Desulfosporosinus sp.]MBC2723319.1 hypothetical protein [Desulfosporosinus sp.]MBC2726243.1 hypothetical protein [Desulfosporosinus sp.]
MAKKSTSYRFSPEIMNSLSAWSLLLKKDKTEIIEDSIRFWEANRPIDEIISVEKIIEELKKHQ